MTARIARRKTELLSEAEYVELLESQGGTCAICKRPPKTRSLYTDHDHKTGLVRGLLCFRDNKSLPTWATPSWTDSAWRYLVRHELTELGRIRYTIEDRGFGSGCWIWSRATSAGYGVLWYHGTIVYIHRLMYQGLIEPRHVVHHRCEVKACINPAHLETMSLGDHNRYHERSAATCKRGHPWTDENTYYRPDGSGIRQCRECIRLRTAGAHLANREAKEHTSDDE